MSRNVVLLGIVSLITDASSEIIQPVLPLFIISLGGTGIAIGLIGGFGDSAASIMNIVSGHLSDRRGKKKPFVCLGYCISAIMKLFYPFSRTWPQLLLLRVVERTGKGVRTAPRDALIADSTASTVRGKAFGLHRAMDSGGAIVGSILAFALFWFLGLDLRSVLLIAALIAFLSLPPLFFVEEREAPGTREKLRIGFGALPPELRRFIVVASVFALGNFTYMFFILKAQRSLSGTFLEREVIGFSILLYVLFNIAYTLLAIPAGILSDRMGRRKVIVAGYAIFAIMALGFASFASLPALVVLFALMGAAYALVEGNQRAFVSDLAKADMKGIALGTFHASTSMATLIAGGLAGLLWEQISPSSAFLYGAVMSALAAALFAFLWR